MNFTAPSNKRVHALLGSYLKYCVVCKIGYLSSHSKCFSCRRDLKTSRHKLLDIESTIISHTSVDGDYFALARVSLEDFTFTLTLPLVIESPEPSTGAKVKVVIRRSLNSRPQDPIAYLPKYQLISK